MFVLDEEGARTGEKLQLLSLDLAGFTAVTEAHGDVEAGQTYVFQVVSKKFAFDQVVMTIDEDLTDLVLTAR